MEAVKKPVELKPEPKTPTSAIDLYLQIRLDMSKCIGAYETYIKTMESIKVGSVLLDTTYGALKGKVSKVLSDKNTFLYNHNLEWRPNAGGHSMGLYSISTGQSSDTGMIQVMKEDLKEGEIRYFDQLATIKLQYLTPLDTEIFTALIGLGLIEKKNINVMNQMLKEYMED